MKKYIKKACICIIISLSIVSCEEEGINITSDKQFNENKIIYESKESSISPNFYDDHFKLIELLSENEEKALIMSILSREKIDNKLLEVNMINKFTLDNSDIIMYSIPIKNSQEKVIIYNYDDLFQTSIAEFTNKMFKIRTLDDDLFYSFEINGKNQIGNFIVNQNSKINNFSQNIQSKLPGGDIGLGTEEDCCRKKPSWSACMDCIVSECGSSWFCAVAFGVAPLEMAAAFAASCIGAGPNAWC